MNQAITAIDGLPDPLTTPLETLDVSDPRRFEHDTWQPLFNVCAMSLPFTIRRRDREAPGKRVIFGRSLVLKILLK